MTMLAFVGSAKAENSVSRTDVRIRVNETVVLRAFGKKASGIRWKSCNPETATVSRKGAVEGKSAGTVMIEASRGNEKAVFRVKVENKPVRNMGTASAKARTEFRLKLPKGAKDVKWTSRNRNVKVDEDGNTSAVRAGLFKDCVLAETKGKTYVFSVKAKPWFEKRKVTLRKGESYDLNLIGTNDGKAVWTASDERVASVGETGVVKAKKDGTAVVKATVHGMTASVRITSESEIATPDNLISKASGSGQTTSVKVNTNKGRKTFVVFNQQTYPSFGWLPDGGCAVCATTTVIRAYGKGGYSAADPTYVVNHANGGAKFNFFADGILNSLRNAGVAYERVNYYSGQVSKMVSQLRKGTPMLISVMGNGSLYYHSSGHSLVALGMTDGGKVIVADSYAPFFGKLVYELSPESLFSVMCDDACSSYAVKEVAVIK